MIFKTLIKKFKNNRRGLFRTIAGMFPAWIRHRIIRNNILVDSKAACAFEYKIATTIDELEQAFRILHDAYVDQGYMTQSKSGLRFLKYFALPSTTTIIAKKGEEVIGTMSIIRRTRMGLPMETIFNLDQLTQLDSEVAEISSLAVAKKYRGKRGEVFLPLCRFLHQYCAKLMKVRYMVIAVHPTMSDLYRALFGFQDLKNFFVKKVDASEYSIKKYSFANGNPAVPLILDLENLYSFLKNAQNQKSNSETLFSYFFKEEFPSMHFPERFAELNIDPVLSFESIKYFIQRTLHDGWLQQLSSAENHLLNNIYLGRITQFETVLSKNYRRSRLVYSFKGTLEIHGLNQINKSLHFKSEVMDISKSGLSLQVLTQHPDRILSDEELSSQSLNCTFRFWSHGNKQIQINAEIVWRKNNQIGLQIKDENLDWLQFFNIVSFSYRRIYDSDNENCTHYIV